MMHNSEASENWDDDFEFHSNKTATRPPNDAHQDRHEPRHRDSHETTENWDDDFAEEDDDEDEPSSSPAVDADSPNSNNNEDTNAGTSSAFSFPPPVRATQRTPRASKIQQRLRTASGSTARQEWGGESSDEDEDAELGFGADEDRTVTARTRRTLAPYSLNSSPPPPVPPLPGGITPASSIGRGAGLGMLGLNIPDPGLGLQPFPRSPTASVFSAPDNASIAYTHTSAGSTTALTRPRQVAQLAKGLAGLPPSPPIHRERRRLRKKSRPNGAGGGSGVVEMREMMGRRGLGRESSEDAETAEEDWDAEDGLGAGPSAIYGSSSVAATSSSSSAAYPQNAYSNAHPNNSSASAPNPYGMQPVGAGASGSHVVLGSPGLLARIGSVKRWGFGGGAGAASRRKKGSSISVESEGLGDPELDIIQDITAHANGFATEATPRPPSANSLRTGSHSSHSGSRHSYAHPQPPPTTPPKNSSKSRRHSQYGGSGSGQQENVPMTPPRTPHTPPDASAPRGWFFRGASGSPADREESLGFVQIRRTIRPLNGDGGGEDATPTGKTQQQNPTPDASPSKGYGILGVGRPSGAVVGSVEDLGRKEGMGFVERNVRRISLVGQRHKRTKSGVSITAVVGLGDEKENGGGKGKKGGGSEKTSIDGLPPPSQLAVPPVDVQLQPPSPPQTVRSASGSTATMKASAPINIGSPRKLDVLHPAPFSPTFSLGSSPGSLPLASPISLASSSSPSLTPYSSSASPPPSRSHSHSNSPSPKPPVSPGTASLGRSAGTNPVVGAAAAVAASSPLVNSATGTMRRNSLGDLKIPARISQAQVGLRRDLGMVREFARNVEELKELQNTYQTLVLEVQGILDAHVLHHPVQSREKEESARTSPTFFKRHRSNTSSSQNGPPSAQQVQQQAYKQMASAFYTINSKYRISWECAELLIELGGGGTSTTPPSTSNSAPAMQQTSVGGSDGIKTKRERAITLQDADGKPLAAPPPLATTSSLGAMPGPPLASPGSNLAWRASTGRNDLSQRQLLLLKEMLNPTPGGPDESFGAEDIPEEIAGMMIGSSTTVNRDWRWGDPMNSTVTLPSEESASAVPGAPGKDKKRRSSRMRMTGIRDMLRALTKGGGGAGTPPIPVSSTSVSTESSSDLHGQHLYQHRQVATHGKQQRRRAKTSAGPESVSVRSTHRPMSPFDPPSLKTASPRRPSLASIFRIGKGKTPPPSAAADVSMEGEQDGYEHEVYPTFSGISGGRESASNSTGDEEEDWDRMEDSASDAETAAAAARRGGSTIRGRSPYMHASFLAAAPGRPTTPLRSPSGSRTSVHDLTAGAAGPARGTRLSNVEEHADSKSPISTRSSKAESPSRHFSRSRRGGKTGSVRSMPPATLPDPKLAMTPENIKPLLENAREVHARLSDCIAEIRTLLAARP
ncbi:hypothetical protein R3P38DRAFT_543541 [Favolaschia claudopus]|uniref:Uncharacterized protein n=1 Tax=Favolaschia claudopus TaxID=2862362 RepID=A0AAW0CKV5_9AGAR